MSIAQAVLIKAKPFAPESARAVRGTQNPFFDTVQGSVKCLPPISRLRSIFDKLIAYPRQESCPRVPLFPNPLFNCYITLLIPF